MKVRMNPGTALERRPRLSCLLGKLARDARLDVDRAVRRHVSRVDEAAGQIGKPAVDVSRPLPAEQDVPLGRSQKCRAERVRHASVGRARLAPIEEALEVGAHEIRTQGAVLEIVPCHEMKRAVEEGGIVRLSLLPMGIDLGAVLIRERPAPGRDFEIAAIDADHAPARVGARCALTSLFHVPAHHPSASVAHAIPPRKSRPRAIHSGLG